MNTPADLALVAGQQYVQLTTYRRNGEAVATPVWIARDLDHLVVITNDNTGKVKRLRHDPRVALRPCSARGRVAPEAPTWTGTGVVVREPEQVQRVRDAMSASYLLARIGNTLASLLGPVMARGPRAGILITLD